MRRRFSQSGKPEAADDESRIRSVALALQTYREHGAKELEAKLSQKGYDSLTAAQVVEDLRESGLVSDQRFADAFIRSHAARGRGPIRIRHELRAIGVASELVESGLKSLEVDWFEVASRVRHRKFGADLPDSYAQRAKQMRFLQYRGFSTDQIRAAFAVHAHEADELQDLDPDD